MAQAGPFRRMDVHGGLELYPASYGYASGGYIADSKVSGQVSTVSQQQWYSQDSNFGSWSGSVWNMVFSGVAGAPAQSFPSPPMTTLATTPASRDVPFLYIDSSGNYHVFLPSWNGNGGETIFFQNEMPYDPPNQAAWMNGSSDGYAAYELAPGVTTHQAYGLGSYCYFNVNKSVVADHAFETPTGSGIGFHDILTVSLGGVGVIEHVVNETGGATPSNTTPVDVVSYP